MLAGTDYELEVYDGRKSDIYNLTIGIAGLNGEPGADGAMGATGRNAQPALMVQ